MSLFVFGQSECRRLVSFQVMAAFAAVEVRFLSKLSCMSVSVTVGAALKLDFEDRVFAFRKVALRALKARVFTLKRVCAGGMFFNRERGRLPSLHRMTRSTLSAVRSLGKLAIVGIGFVAIQARRKDQGLLKISVNVTLGAVDGHVLAFERKLRLRMIEALVHSLQRDFLPAICVVATLASLREAAVMRIFVAIRTQIERDAHISRLAIRSARVAFGALHLRVQARQWIARLRMIELTNTDRIPIQKVVTRLAARPETTLMLVLMT